MTEEVITIATRRWALGLLAAGLMLIASLPAARADDAKDLVQRARFTAQHLLNDRDFETLRTQLREARGVLIIPQLIKGGLILGAEGGSGVFLVRGSDGTWSPPAFYTLAGGSVGLQVGGQVSEVIFTLMNEGAVEAMLADEFKFGADLSLAFGPLGAGVEASATTNLDADILAFSKAAGLFGGGAFEGAKLFVRDEWNHDYYGPGAEPRAIVIERRFHNADADRLRATLP